jgi:multidrug efflux pump subunit AcrB
MLEKILASDKRVAAYTAYVGSTTPTFFYSIIPDRRVPDLAELYVRTHSESDNVAVAQKTEELMIPQLPDGARLISKQLMQGPPVKAAIELELHGEDLASMRASVERVINKAQALPGVKSIRTDAPRFLPTLNFSMD